MIDYNLRVKEEKRLQRKKKIFVILLVVFIILIFISVFLFLRSDSFNVKDYKVYGNKTVSSDEIIDVVKEISFGDSWLSRVIFPNDNSLIALFERNEVEKELSLRIPSLKMTAMMINVIPGEISVNVEERERYGIWCQNLDTKDCYWFDKSGVIFESGPWAEGELIRKVVGSPLGEVKLGGSFLDKDSTENLIAIFDFIEKNNLNKKTIILGDNNLFEAQTKEGDKPVIYFSLRENPNFASEAFEKIKKQIPKLEYIDLRVKNRVYYK